LGTLTLKADGSISDGAGSYLPIDAGTFAGSGTSIAVVDSADVTLGAVSTTAGNLIIQANTISLNGTTTLDANSDNVGPAGVVVLAGTGAPGLQVSGTPTITPSSRFIFYAANALLTKPPVVGTSLGPFVADRVFVNRPLGSPFAFDPADPIPAFVGSSGNALIFASSERPADDPSLFIDIPVELYHPVSITFGEYDPTRFGEVGDLWMSSSELYEIERKAGTAPKAVPAKVDRMKYVEHPK
jgi:hypothetical protein